MMLCRQIYRKKIRSFSDRRWFFSLTSVSPSPGASGGRKAWTIVPAAVCYSPAHSARCATTSFSSFSRLATLKVTFGLKGCCFSTQAEAFEPEGGILDVPLAQTGEGIAECELIRWFVKEGDQVEEFQPLCEVQSDKATIEITSRYKGTISHILHVPGNIVKVGETLLKIAVDRISAPTQAVDISENVKEVKSVASSIDDHSSAVINSRIGGVLSTPAVRILAKQYGVDINVVPGTGKDGRILKEDVLNYAAVHRGTLVNSQALPNPAEQLHSVDITYPDISASRGLGNEDTTILLRGFQRAMVKSMTLAAKIPHFHYIEEINCDALLQLKRSFQKANSDPEVKHTFLPFLLKSLSMAFTKYPMLNSCFKEELYEVTVKGSHNIGVAMATPHGLVVPNIKKVQSLSILEITKELSRLQKLAMANKLDPEDVSGGTFTLSNIGAIGGKYGSPLINAPEVAIIAIGRIQKIPHFAEDGNVHPASVLTVNVGADHRVLDGATVAKFCNEWKQFIEQPELMMLHMR
ncbi:unnamed protein product [Cuscuta europaea]|uniref:Dihydrolipoamide acetyltransferase component of pyruvate dehydrogenase complex n=1 Tax=Cuscuta europaea TaxID=41803 RepID=A0A9P1EIA4_CUSEU|nr:unnamed protein product [Cuscuta europaea]